MNRTIIVLVTLLICVTGISGAVYYFSQPKNKATLSKITQPVKAVLTAIPSPFPFQDMTIPYLRAKKYEGKLGERELVSDNGSYESYSSSYTSEGLKINGQLTIPKGEAPEGGWPAVVFVHGYIPPAQYETFSRYVDYVDYIARNGFVVFKIDLRGHGDSEGRPGGAYYSPDYVIDTLNAYNALTESGFVNPKKIGLWGHSMAGNVTFRALAAKPDIPAVVIWGGAGFSYVDLIKYRITDASYAPRPSTTQSASRRRLTELVGEVSDNNPFWKIVAPTNYINDMKGAIQLHHAVDDNTVNVQYSRDLNTLLDKSKVEHEYYEYTSGDHNISGASFGPAMERTVDFYKKHLAQ